MKNKARPVLYVLALLMFSSCSLFEKDDDIDMEPDPLLTNSYTGSLTVRYTSIYPEFDESATMPVDIDKELGYVTIGSATLSYSGETFTSAVSKITRTGSWSIDPTARIEEIAEERYIQIDAGVKIQNDITKVWVLENGTWKVKASSDNSLTPNSDLSFKLKDAELAGAVLDAQGTAGSETWTLLLTVEPDYDP